jgi:hypothetical protein
MGAAFMVALVLIYVLVVWEFGNFRIPALIMAPIPLTLLGIIPMHAIMGAEFTATSMIGWIALAGIIVRNSILLVDFSIHEVQRGVPVKEAVIRSCKTRTRPIMITALALVAGSSVIFTDPIFQGMAISLASGVMVSTILTLVVIPLGCIKAERALCQVAAAGCAPGTPLPEAILAVTAPVEQAVAPARKSSFSFSNLLLTVWAKVAGALMMVFYAIRGIFLLLGQMVSKPARPAPAPAPVAAKPAAPPASSVVHSGPATAAPAAQNATPGHPAVSAGPGVTKVITPAKATIVPPEPAKPAPAPAAVVAPAAPAAPAPAVAAAEPAAPAATNGKKKAAPSSPVKEEKAAQAAPAVSTEGRAKASGRRGIRLKLIKPGENDPGLK